MAYCIVARATTLDVKEPIAPAHAAQPSPIAESRRITHAPDLETVRRLKDELLRTCAERAPKAAEGLEAGFEDTMALTALPERYRKPLRTINGVERLNQQLRRGERVIRIFPNEDSALRLLGVVLMEIDESWTTGHRHFEISRCRSTGGGKQIRKQPKRPPTSDWRRYDSHEGLSEATLAPVFGFDRHACVTPRLLSSPVVN